MTDEAQRLHSGPTAGEKPKGVLTSFNLICDGNAEQVLGRCKEVLGLVSAVNLDPWPSVEQWGKTLPKWFVDACFPEVIREEAERWPADERSGGRGAHRLGSTLRPP